MRKKKNFCGASPATVGDLLITFRVALGAIVVAFPTRRQGGGG
jgi:hypothetical protein